MHPFVYQQAQDAATAIRAASGGNKDGTATQAPRQFLAGGTSLIDLMKLSVMRPDTLIDINHLDKSWAAVTANDKGLRLGALARMSDVADNESIRTSYPLIAQSLQLAASAQLRNMASLGGNVLQRTRCTYFRDITYANCNKRTPGSGCAAMDGVNRTHAVLGVSDQCIASYPGDFAQALIALDAKVEISSDIGPRLIAFSDLHRQPGNSPQVETVLKAGELITAFSIEPGDWRRSVYIKIRDRESYEFALASAAVAIQMDGTTIKEARIALGGVATAPWRAANAEALLKGQPFSEDLATRAAAAAFEGAKPRDHNGYKIALGQRTLVRALVQAAAMEI